MTANSSPQKALIIDDSELVGTKVGDLLKEIPGIDYLGQAKTVKSGLKTCFEIHPDIVFLDIKLPDGNGKDVLIELKKSLPTITVIMLTNFDSDFHKQQFSQLGADYFLDKTRDFMKISEVVEKIVRHKRQNQPIALKLRTKLFDNNIVGSADQALDFIGNILESSTEYSIIGKDLNGTILLWNEGARLLYGYEPDEVVGKINSSVLHVPEDVRVLTAARYPI